jgi:hypothetical protein
VTPRFDAAEGYVSTRCDTMVDYVRNLKQLDKSKGPYYLVKGWLSAHRDCRY